MTAERVIEIPEGTHVNLDNNVLEVRGSKGEITREFKHSYIVVEIKDNKIFIKTDHERRRTLAILGTWSALMRNMIIGVNTGYEAKLKIVYSHFPVKFVVQGDRVIINNFLGEKKARITPIMPGTDVKLNKDEIIVTGIKKENVGQTAAKIETVCKITGLDRRVFQDGCFITQKPQSIGD